MSGESMSGSHGAKRNARDPLPLVSRRFISRRLLRRFVCTGIPGINNPDNASVVLAENILRVSISNRREIVAHFLLDRRSLKRCRRDGHRTAVALEVIELIRTFLLRLLDVLVQGRTEVEQVVGDALLVGFTFVRVVVLDAEPVVERHRFARWRRGWDSNPRYPRRYAGFQDQCVQPLCHPSTTAKRASPFVLPDVRHRESGTRRPCQWPMTCVG